MLPLTLQTRKITVSTASVNFFYPARLNSAPDTHRKLRTPNHPGHDDLRLLRVLVGRVDGVPQPMNVEHDGGGALWRLRSDGDGDALRRRAVRDARAPCSNLNVNKTT